MQRPNKSAQPDPFENVRKVGLALPDVEATTKYDGSPILKVRGSFMAGLATHRSAEPATLVVRVDLEHREWLLEDAPETYYLTDYYRSYPVVLVRLSQTDPHALRDLLSVSWRLTVAKAGRRVAKLVKERSNGTLSFTSFTLEARAVDPLEPRVGQAHSSPQRQRASVRRRRRQRQSDPPD